jgi:hypothetical protein
MPRKNRHRAEGELFSLDIPSYRTFPVRPHAPLAHHEA